MQQDLIVEEVRRIRDQYAKLFNYDLHAICRDIREQQKKDGGKVVSFPPKRITRTQDLTPDSC